MTTAIKERPILFSGPMVRAILDGRKTQTRRIVKPQPPACCVYEINGNQNKAICTAGPDIDVPERPWFVPPYGNKAQHFVECPFGANGARLWVRETWAPMSSFDPSPETGAIYKADDHPSQKYIPVRWTPSIHMPRWASRITLEITGVRVERLQSISNADCVAEGIEPIGTERNIGDCLGRNVMTQAGRIEGKCSTVRQLYSELWTTINGTGSWALNPWVWVITFERRMN